jgi:hypothetical protein
MRRLRFFPAFLGGAVFVAVGACLVFDGRRATETEDASTADSEADDTPEEPRGDGNATPPRDAAPTDGGAPEDSPGGDSGTLGPDTGGATNGVICEQHGEVCTGGKESQCCAKLNGGVWVYAKPACDKSCSEAGPEFGYYDYACDDDDQCEGGDICCAYRQNMMFKPPPFTSSSCESKCPKYGSELCQPGHPCHIGTCVRGDSEYLPPDYWVCRLP